MTFQQILTKIKKRFLWLILGVVIGAGFSFNLAQQEIFETSLTLGIHFNADNYLQNQSDAYGAYLDSLPILSNFLVTNFSSTYTQDKVAKELGLVIPANKKSLFEITKPENGYVTLTYRDENIAKTEKFFQVVTEIYKNQIIPKWNQNRLSNFTIKPIDNFERTIIKQVVPLQIKILPIIASILTFLILIVLLPEFNASQLKITKNKPKK